MKESCIKLTREKQQHVPSHVHERMHPHWILIQVTRRLTSIQTEHHLFNILSWICCTGKSSISSISALLCATRQAGFRTVSLVFKTPSNRMTQARQHNDQRHVTQRSIKCETAASRWWQTARIPTCALGKGTLANGRHTPCAQGQRDNMEKHVQRIVRNHPKTFGDQEIVVKLAPLCVHMVLKC